MSNPIQLLKRLSISHQPLGYRTGYFASIMAPTPMFSNKTYSHIFVQGSCLFCATFLLPPAPPPPRSSHHFTSLHLTSPHLTSPHFVSLTQSLTINPTPALLRYDTSSCRFCPPSLTPSLTRLFPPLPPSLPPSLTHSLTHASVTVRFLHFQNTNQTNQ